eukprot:COSAG02_NODE_1712_length_11221_cov_93.698346_9_plen_97_part_00
MAQLEMEGLDCLVLLNFQCTGITTVRRCCCHLPHAIDWGGAACLCRPVLLGGRVVMVVQHVVGWGEIAASARSAPPEQGGSGKTLKGRKKKRIGCY